MLLISALIDLSKDEPLECDEDEGHGQETKANSVSCKVSWRISVLVTVGDVSQRASEENGLELT